MTEVESHSYTPYEHYLSIKARGNKATVGQGINASPCPLDCQFQGTSIFGIGGVDEHEGLFVFGSQG